MLLSLALRNSLRNRRRSLLTATMVMLGVASLTVAMSWLEGLFGSTVNMAANLAGHVRVVDADYARREQLNPLHENIAESAPLEAAIRAVPGVVAVYPRISMGVTATVGEEIGEEFGLVQGGPLALFEGPLALPGHLVEGRMLASDDEVVIGKKLVEKMGGKLGDDVVLLGQTQDGSMSPAKLKLVGIVDLGNAMQNRQIFVTLEKVRYMADIPDGAVELAVYGAHRDDGAELAARLGALPELSGKDVKSWDQRPPFDNVMGLLSTVKAVAASAMVFITGLGVLNTMLMSVLERTGEIGVMRAMGLRRMQVIWLFVLEALGISAIGGVLGAVLGGLGGYWLQVHGVNLGSVVDKLPATIPMNSTIYGQVTPEILVSAVLLGLAMAVVGGLVPAYRASRIEPIEAMRHRR
ncbi:MAG: FtsX-like permease family protein [Pseudomonadota bacterium]|nr:FtsX-like permease family protein [Pseudomonadota bacterium]